MIANDRPRGLVATTRANATSPLRELAACCGWPVLLEAGPRRLLRELVLRRPDCVLFWTDDWRDVTSTAKLIAWTRQRGPRPYRVAVACELAAEVEAVFRAAGAHSFLPVCGRSGADVADAFEQLVASVTPSARVVELAEPWEYTSELVRPP